MDMLQQLFDVLLPKGLLTYKKIGSNASLPNRLAAEAIDRENRQGVLFVVRDKAHFANGHVKGYIVTSKESLLADVDALTHFTPNVYRYGAYSDDKRRFIKGFSEDNLQQINTFVVDIDTKRHTVNDLLLACMDESIGLPTFILESERGYQLYFVLSSPLFISNKNNFRGLKVAKRISDNLKRSLKSVDADIYCNDFGFFRIPKTDNIAYVDLNNTYTMHELIQWSMRRDDDLARPLFVVPSKMQVASLTQSEWFYKLICATDVKGEKGQIGRNNVLFTLALVCFQDGKDEAFAFDLLDQYSTNLRNPLPTQEMQSIIASAYSGKYKGAKKEYIEQLLALYVQGAKDMVVHFGHKTWYKHKKAREDRERSHCHEWEQDLTNWITAEKSVSEPFIWRTQKEMCEAVGIPSSTLNKLLKASKTIIKTTTGKGRNAKTGWTTVALYIQYIIWLKQDLGTRFAESLRTVVQEHIALLEPIAGYTTLVHYAQKMLQERPLTEQLAMPDVLRNTG